MTLRARDIMETKLVTVAPDLTLAEVAEVFYREHITGAPVIDPRRPDELLGLISRSDLVRFPLYQGAVAGMVGEYLRDLGAAEGITQETSDEAPALPDSLRGHLANHTVREAMAASPQAVTPDATVREVAAVMVAKRLHRVLVRDGEKLVGLISSLDIARMVAEGRAA